MSIKRTWNSLAHRRAAGWPEARTFDKDSSTIPLCFCNIDFPQVPGPTKLHPHGGAPAEATRCFLQCTFYLPKTIFDEKEGRGERKARRHTCAATALSERATDLWPPSDLFKGSTAITQKRTSLGPTGSARRDRRARWEESEAPGPRRWARTRISRGGAVGAIVAREGNRESHDADTAQQLERPRPGHAPTWPPRGHVAHDLIASPHK